MRKLLCVMMSFVMLLCGVVNQCEASKRGGHRHAFTEGERSRQHLTNKQQRLESKRQRKERKQEAKTYQKHASYSKKGSYNSGF